MLRPLVIVALLAGALPAQIVAPQPVSFTGVVELVTQPLPPILCTPPQFQLACNGGVFFLESGDVDLSAWVGQNVKLVGVSVNPQCPLYEVNEVISPPPAQVELCGTPAIGCPIRFRSGPGGISQHLLWISASPGLVTLGVQKGSLLLGEPLMVFATGVSGDAAGFAVDLTVPPDANLIGLPLWVQNARRDVGPVGPLALGNAVCFTLLPATVVCIQPDC